MIRLACTRVSPQILIESKPSLSLHRLAPSITSGSVVAFNKNQSDRVPHFWPESDPLYLFWCCQKLEENQTNYPRWTGKMCPSPTPGGAYSVAAVAHARVNKPISQFKLSLLVVRSTSFVESVFRTVVRRPRNGFIKETRDFRQKSNGRAVNNGSLGE